jgi:trk system potassium uptake protein TrkH
VAAWAQLRDRAHANAFGRTLGRQSLRSSVVIVVGGSAGAVAALAALLVLQRPPGALDQQHAAFLRYAFECVSALGTVGLSTGLTPALEPLARLLFCVLMLCGRLGPLTVAASLSRAGGRHDWRYPEEEVMVG